MTGRFTYSSTLASGSTVFYTPPGNNMARIDSIRAVNLTIGCTFDLYVNSEQIYSLILSTGDVMTDDMPIVLQPGQSIEITTNQNNLLCTIEGYAAPNININAGIR